MTEHEVGLPLDSRGKRRFQTVNDMPSETVQSDRHLTDIQTILKSFGALGQGALDQTALQYRDVSEFTDLHDAMLQARAAEVDFMKLPSKVREIFDHDVAVWLDTAHDEEKRNALVEAGFLDPPEEVVETPTVAAPGPGAGVPAAEGATPPAPEGGGETPGVGGTPPGA